MWLVKPFLSLLINIPVMLAGLVVVAIALPFRHVVEGSARRFTQFPGTWALVRLPFWALWWDNAFDGALGDKRGWWHNETGDCRKFWSMYKWLALRNPANYFGRNILGIDVLGCKVEKLGGVDHPREATGVRCYQYLKATLADGSGVRSFKACYAYPFAPNYGLTVYVGYKVNLDSGSVTPDSSDADRYKGFAFRINPFKSLG